MAINNKLLTSPSDLAQKGIVGSAIENAKRLGGTVSKSISDSANTIKTAATGAMFGKEGLQNTQGGNGGVAASANPSGLANITSGADLQKKALGEGPTKTLPPNFTPISTEEDKKNISNEYAKSDYGKNALFNENAKAFGSAESRPSSYMTSSGEIKQSLGGTIYTQDSEGNILKRSPTGEISNVQNRVSTISTGWTPEKSAAYRADKAFREGADRLPPVARAMAYAKRQRLSEERGIERDKALSNAAIQERTLGLNARKEAAQEQRDTQRLGLDFAKAQSEAEARQASAVKDTLELVNEVSKLGGDVNEKAAIYKQRGLWNPVSIRSLYNQRGLGKAKTPDELRELMVNDESIDPADYEAIEFSYLGNQ